MLTNILKKYNKIESYDRTNWLPNNPNYIAIYFTNARSICNKLPALIKAKTINGLSQFNYIWYKETWLRSDITDVMLNNDIFIVYRHIQPYNSCTILVYIHNKLNSYRLNIFIILKLFQYILYVVYI